MQYAQTLNNLAAANTTTTATSSSKDVIENALLTFYNDPPTEEINLEEFESLATYRRNLLEQLQTIVSLNSITAKLANNVKDGNNNNNNNNTTKSNMMQDVKKLNDEVRRYLKHNQDTNVRNDIISHFILLLASCNDEVRRKRFIQEESLLFRWRAKTVLDYTKLAQFAIQEGLAITPFDLTPYHQYLTPTFKGNLSNDVKQYVTMINYLSKHSGIQSNLLTNPIYSLPFSDVLDLFTRDKLKVVVVKGKAYITGSSIVEILEKLYRDRLERKLIFMNDHLAQSLVHHPLLPHVTHKINMGGNNQDAINNTGFIDEEITRKDLPLVAQQSFPLCMSRLYHHVTREHHVRYSGRGQLNLFYRGIGLSAEEALDWWRAAFAPKCAGDKFDKEYKYSFRHNYGLEGKRAQYSAPGCAKLINEQVPPQDAHGCPFKHLSQRDPNGMRNMLQNTLKPTVDDTSLRSEYVDQIMSLCVDGHYQIACTTLWKFTHDSQSPDENIIHPNQYYRQSRAHYRAIHEEKSKKEQADGENSPLQPITIQ